MRLIHPCWPQESDIFLHNVESAQGQDFDVNSATSNFALDVLGSVCAPICAIGHIL